MRFLALRLSFAVALLLGLAGLASASAGELALRDVLRSKEAVSSCGTNDRLLATYKFVRAQLASPDRCLVYRYVVKDAAQRACLSAVVATSGQNSAAFLSSLGITDGATPAFCNEGCDCAHPISYRSID
jgi:hypothetical protein